MSGEYLFDCIRVAWVVMLVCILFFELSLLRSLEVALIVGLGWLMVVRGVQSMQRVTAATSPHPLLNAMAMP